MPSSANGVLHWVLLCSIFDRHSASTISQDHHRRTATVDSHGSVASRALMRQEDQAIADTGDATQEPGTDTLWARFFGASGSAINTTDGSETLNSSSSNSTQTLSDGSSAKNLTAAARDVVSKLTEANVSDEDCKDSWSPAWSSDIPEENCKSWARNSEWGALSSAASLKGACRGEWAQKNCMATCGCEAVRSMRLDEATHKTLAKFGYNAKENAELQALLDGMSADAKESLIHVLATALMFLNPDAVANAMGSAGNATQSSTSTSTTTTTHAVHTIIDLVSQLGLSPEQAEKLRATLALIDPAHYDEIIAVLKVIWKISSTSSTLSKEDADAAAASMESTEDCKDRWTPEWSSLLPEENCQRWASNNEWGALANSSTLTIACHGPWAQSHCMATCGCEAVRHMRLNEAIHKAAARLGYNALENSQLDIVLDRMTTESKVALMEILAHMVAMINPVTSTYTSTVTTTLTTTTTVGVHTIMDLIDQLGLSAEQARQLNSTLGLIDPDHYTEILAVLRLILGASSSGMSSEEVIKAAEKVGLHKEDVLKINATLDGIKPDLHDEIVTAINETGDLVNSIGVRRTGKAIVRHMKELSRPSRELLPKEDEPNEFVIRVAPSDSRQQYRDREGEDPRGFHFKVSLAVDRVVAFIESRAQVEIEDPRTLSLAIARVDFSWPSPSCSNEESGFTDYRLLDFHAGEVTNEGSDCGALSASSVDRDGEMHLPAQGNQDLFWLAGMFGTKYFNRTGGAEVAVKIEQLVLHEFRDNGDVIEYGMCGRGSFTWKEQHFYVGCPAQIPLEITHPDDCLGRAVKLCAGSVPSDDPAVTSTCFDV
mmetsp:Transcript_62199/g.145767  ORF Transcript_62199/g.145767 Transcript_62199/m.145767 type:complete len:830 (-) Transcript_62199:69-2558(-)